MLNSHPENPPRYYHFIITHVPGLEEGRPVFKVPLFHLADDERFEVVCLSNHSEPVFGEVHCGAFFSLLDLAKIGVVWEECVSPYEVLVVKNLVHTSSVQLCVETNDGAVFILARATVRVTYKRPTKDKINVLLNKQ